MADDIENEDDGGSSKKIWKIIIQTAITILTAIATTLGLTSCMGIPSIFS